jgi:inosine-uridine nucleoside N-ribohydrolase
VQIRHVPPSFADEFARLKRTGSCFGFNGDNDKSCAMELHRRDTIRSSGCTDYSVGMRIFKSFLVPIGAVLLFCGGIRTVAAQASANPSGSPSQLTIIDTDIGDDIDDAFALALALESPELKILGVTTAFGDTELRARLVDRYLAALGRKDIPVAAGVATPHDNVFTQAAYAEREPARIHADGVRFMLDAIRKHPGEVTIIAIGPEGNLAAAIRQDAATFKKVKRVVLMGGSVYRGYGDEHRPAEPEWNIDRDPASARALFTSGVPIFMMPLDSTQVKLPVQARERIFSFGSPLTDQLTLLYHQWVAHTDNHAPDPTLFDPVAVTYAVRPELCPAKALRIEIDGKGFTKPVEGEPNAQVCLQSDEKGFLDLLLSRVAPRPAQKLPVASGRDLEAPPGLSPRLRSKVRSVSEITFILIDIRQTEVEKWRC